jgi:hypothetical protein
MTHAERIAAWKAEENIAHIHGRDFSHIDGQIHRFLLVAQKAANQ